VSSAILARHRSGRRGDEGDEGVHDRNDEPFQLRFYAFQDESLLTREGWRSPGISRISSNDEGFDEGFHEPCRSSWSI
jgi:hypothetical protein